jgi:hypothetical protein
MTDDERIAALFAAPLPQADEAFVLRVERALIAEQRMEAVRRSAWKRFAVEAAGSGAVVAAFILLGRLAPAASGAGVDLVSPAMAAVLLLACWFAVEMRPGAARG